MTNINFNFEKTIGKIKPMHAVGQPPMTGLTDQHYHYLDEAHIPYSRLHDVGGMFGGNAYVDIPNVFRDFDADENDPASYDFAFTDVIISYLFKHGCEPIYRLGVTIENYHETKAYRIFPPKDNKKWARICEHVVRHYNEGWANGFHYGIKYWEIWNEPDGDRAIKDNAMWKGTPEQYFELYEAASKHLKACFGDSIKVGGYASCGFYSAYDPTPNPRHDHFVEFFEKFFKFIKSTNSPIDFFSWHSYATLKGTEKMQEYTEKRLCEFGYPNLETQCNEWNNAVGIGKKATSFASANSAAMMLSMQNRKIDILCFYDARINSCSPYQGLFDPNTCKPYCTYYSFKAFGELYTLGNQTEATADKASDGLYFVSAESNGKKAALIANISNAELELATNLGDNMKMYLIDEVHFLTKIDISPKSFKIGSNEVIFAANYDF